MLQRRLQLGVGLVAVLALSAVTLLVPIGSGSAGAATELTCTFSRGEEPFRFQITHTGAPTHRLFADDVELRTFTWGEEGDVFKPSAEGDIGQAFEAASYDDADREVERVRCLERPDTPGAVTGITCNYRYTDGVGRITWLHTGEAVHRVVLDGRTLATFFSGEAGDRMAFRTRETGFAMRVQVLDGPWQVVDRNLCTDSLEPPPRWRVTVEPENPPLIAVNDTADVDHAAQVDIDVLANDSEIVGAEHLITRAGELSPESIGRVSIIDGGKAVRFDAFNGFFGTATFTYRIARQDATGEAATATVRLTINPGTCMGRTATVPVLPGLATVGTAGDDVIVGTLGDDEIRGLGGDDYICGLTGRDELRGNSGADRINGGIGADIIDGGDGDDALLGGQGDDRISGAEGADIIHGNLGNDRLLGLGGNDRIFGYAGEDVIDGGDGDDRLHGNFGNDVMHGGNGDDRMFGYGDNDELRGEAGNDLLGGNFGDDLLDGGDGDDKIFGSDGQDTIIGGDGRDVLEGNSGDDLIEGGPRGDIIDGGINVDRCIGNGGVDTATRCETVVGVP